MATVDKTISIVGTLQSADLVTRIKLDDIMMATGRLTKLFEFEATLAAATVNQAVSLHDATVANFVFARVDVVDGGDCTITVTPQGGSATAIVCNGGEIWLNKTAITAITVSSTSGANVKIIGGGIA